MCASEHTGACTQETRKKFTSLNDFLTLVFIPRYFVYGQLPNACAYSLGHARALGEFNGGRYYSYEYLPFDRLICMRYQSKISASR